ncbi:MAG TPA: hypothetical protein VIM22_08480 [Solirubrobacteraceae bacterium]
MKLRLPHPRAHALSELVLRGIPAIARSWRAGMRPSIRRAPTPAPPARGEVDPLLHAASWGLEQPQGPTGYDGAGQE